MTGKYASHSKEFAKKIKGKGPVKVAWNTYLQHGTHNIAKGFKAGGYRTGMVGKYLGGVDEGVKIDKKANVRKPAIAKQVAENYACQREDMKLFGFDEVGVFMENNPNHSNLPTEVAGYHEDWKAQKAIDFIRSSDDQPFFLYYASNSPPQLHPQR